MKKSNGTTGPALFRLGKLVTTHGALAACSPHYLDHLSRHARGDWGRVSAQDAARNRKAVTQGGRIRSAYPIDPEEPCNGSGKNTLWIITEADRSATTFLLPEEDEPSRA